jgi:hypothetical protein
MMEAIFAKVAKHPVTASIKRSIGRGDHACEFLISLTPPVHDDSRAVTDDFAGGRNRKSSE